MTMTTNTSYATQRTFLVDATSPGSQAGSDAAFGATALLPEPAGRTLSDQGIVLDDLGVRRPSLDDVFLALTGHATDPSGARGG